MFPFLGCPVKIHSNTESVKINVRDKETKEIREIKLLDYVSEKCPSLVGKNAVYYPTLWLPNGHLQTAYAAYANFSGIHLINYERQFVETPDGGQIAVDWTPPVSQKPFDNTPTIVVLHGLTGGSHESYIRCLLEVLITPPNNYRAVVINFRGCAESQITSPRLYSAGVTDDLRTCLRYVQKCIPDSPLIAVGFSMGANILIKANIPNYNFANSCFLSENAPLIAAVSVGNPFELVGGSKALSRTYLGKYVYSPSMANNLKICLKRHEHIMKQDNRISIPHAMSSYSLREFDSRLTSKCFGFETVDHYYRDASSYFYITKVRVPLLCLNAEDDPIVPVDCLPFDEIIYNPNCILATTRYGGHLGWFTGFRSLTRWCIKPLSEFCIAIFEANDPSAGSRTILEQREDTSSNEGSTVVDGN
ncbi:10757_t:CDS:2 [Scutellospora calospora]|uniref:10757_t:CDS:1 n=1 Tax=Scutellospora calospora TaxID=85575 RepID=A0ACA9LJT2_9GLOM|nr:10757_t:CDS:2 [Scutellospora calospora]